MPEQRRFPRPWTVEEPDAKLQQQQLLHRPRRQWPRAGYVYFEDAPGRRAAAELLTRERSPADRRQCRPSCRSCSASSRKPPLLAHELLRRRYSRKGPEVIWSTVGIGPRFPADCRGWEVWYGLTTGREVRTLKLRSKSGGTP
jgi:hypothetical protein